jgi:hypothetical protein
VLRRQRSDAEQERLAQVKELIMVNNMRDHALAELRVSSLRLHLDPRS